MIDTSLFIPCLKLSEIFYSEAIKPILDHDFPGLMYSAGCMGSGSEILGYDTPQSMDHHWGPKAVLFLTEDDEDTYAKNIHETLCKKLPHEIRGIPTNFAPPDENGVRLVQKTESGPVNHLVQTTTVKKYFDKYIGADPMTISNVDWLTIPQQKLLEVTAGKVFHDGLHELHTVREKLSYYPHDIWLYILASQWTRISQEEAFVGRCADVGDELGSQLVASRLIRDVMRLCFIMEKKYYPYTKWFGTAFSKLPVSDQLTPLLRQILLSDNGKDRETNLISVYEIVAKQHNALGITSHQETKASLYHGRPYMVIHADTFAQEIIKQIKDEEVKRIAQKNIGSIDQYIDSTDVLSNSQYFDRLKAMYR